MSDMVRRAARAAHPVLVPVATRRFRRAVRDLVGPIRLVVGSGGAEFPGWISTDISWWKGLYLDVTVPWGTRADMVFADNVIEHLGLDGARAFLRNAHEALTPAGRIRIVTPDVEAAARIYLEDPDLTSSILESLREHHHQPAVHSVDLLHAVFHWWGHSDGYQFDMRALTAELEAAGFADVTKFDMREASEGFPPTVQTGREAPTHFAVEAHA
jgi:predicted SAM-dependent methyltransferase